MSTIGTLRLFRGLPPPAPPALGDPGPGLGPGRVSGSGVWVRVGCRGRVSGSGSGVRVRVGFQVWIRCPSPDRGPGWRFGSGKVRFYFLSEKCTYLALVRKNVLFVLLSEKLQLEKYPSIILSSEKLLSEKSRGAQSKVTQK